MKTTKPRVIISLLAGASLLVTGAMPATAQTSVPNETSRPVIPPGKAGPPKAQGPAPASPAIKATVAEIMSRPKDYAGRNVTITSEVEEVFTPWSLKLDEKQPLAGGIDNDLLIVSAEPLVTMGFNPSWLHQKVSVTGTIRMLQAEDFRREYGRALDDKLFRRYEGKPTLIATSMKIAQ